MSTTIETLASQPTTRALAAARPTGDNVAKDAILAFEDKHAGRAISYGADGYAEQQLANELRLMGDHEWLALRDALEIALGYCR